MPQMAIKKGRFFIQEIKEITETTENFKTAREVETREITLNQEDNYTVQKIFFSPETIKFSFKNKKSRFFVKTSQLESRIKNINDNTLEFNSKSNNQPNTNISIYLKVQTEWKNWQEVKKELEQIIQKNNISTNEIIDSGISKCLYTHNYNNQSNNINVEVNSQESLNSNINKIQLLQAKQLFCLQDCSYECQENNYFDTNGSTTISSSKINKNYITFQNPKSVNINYSMFSGSTNSMTSVNPIKLDCQKKIKTRITSYSHSGKY